MCSSTLMSSVTKKPRFLAEEENFTATDRDGSGFED